jgi:hypothetical protein
MRRLEEGPPLPVNLSSFTGPSSGVSIVPVFRRNPHETSRSSSYIRATGSMARCGDLAGAMPRNHRRFTETYGGILFNNRANAVGQCAVLGQEFRGRYLLTQKGYLAQPGSASGDALKSPTADLSQYLNLPYTCRK